MRSDRRFILVSAGKQAGKTTIGSHWLYREIKSRGPGDYLVASPSSPLMRKKCLPEFIRLFQKDLKLGRYVGGDQKVFTFHDEGSRRTFGYVPDMPTQVFFGHASDPDSLESATIKAAWLDEAGQDRFRPASWEAIQARLAVNLGRVLITTTPYNLGWLKKQFYDLYKQGDTTYDVIRFDSKDNPTFPLEEYYRLQRTMPRWKFNRNFRGMFEKPAGQVYECFDPDTHIIPPIPVPAAWKRFMGVDFGGVNTAAVFLALDPSSGIYYLYREYGPIGGRTAKQHAKMMMQNETRFERAVGGSKSEGQWRDEFRASGLVICEPQVSEVAVGIDRVFALISAGNLRIFSTCEQTTEQVQDYCYKTDDDGEPTEEIKDKAKQHLCDCLRYIGTWISKPRGQTIGPAGITSNARETFVGSLPPGVFNS